MLLIDEKLLDELTEQAKASPRLRMNLDLRNTPDDNSQRMLNALEPDAPLHTHKIMKSTETVVCLQGYLFEMIYNDLNEITEMVDLVPINVCNCKYPY